MKLRKYYIAILAVGLYVSIADGAALTNRNEVVLLGEYADLKRRGDSIITHYAEFGYCERGITVLRSNLEQSEALQGEISKLRKKLTKTQTLSKFNPYLLKLESDLCKTQILTRKALHGSVQNPKTISSLIASLPLLGNPLLGAAVFGGTMIYERCKKTRLPVLKEAALAQMTAGILYCLYHYSQ